MITFPLKEVSKPDETRLLKGLHIKEWTRSKLIKSRPIVFGDITSKRTPIGGTLFSRGKTHTLDLSAFRDFLECLTVLRPAVDAGLTYLPPSFPDDKIEMRRLSNRLISANFSLEELNHQFQEYDLYDTDLVRFEGDFLDLYLPYFKDVPIERILEIRDKQSDMYNDFQRYLENLLKGVDQNEIELRLLGLIKDVDTGIRNLNRLFESTQRE